MESECTPWTGRINEDGYGTLGIRLAHRVAWEHANGQIPPGMTLDHTCHDPALCRLGRKCPHRRCVNLAHLEVCTPEQNKARGAIGRHFAERTHCPAGHPYSGENLMVSGGKRHCRTCRREKMKAQRDTAKRKRCAEAGHEFTPETDAEGKTYCSVCRSATAKRVGVQNRRERCPKGHPYTEENTRTWGNSVRCLQCNRDAVAARTERRFERHAEDYGHSFDLARDANGKRYCKVCRLASPGPGGRKRDRNGQ